MSLPGGVTMSTVPARLFSWMSSSSCLAGLALLGTFLPFAAAASGITPSKVEASYSIEFAGIEIGKFRFQSSVDASTYTLSGSAKFSALLGAWKWSGRTSSTGTLGQGEPQPARYVFKYKSNSKSGSVDMSFSKGAVADRTLEPPSKPSKKIVPLRDEHLRNVLDPMSAVMAMTTGQIDKPCDRKIAIFDGKQRFNLELSFSRKERIKEARPSGEPEVAIVCGVRYIPIAGYKDSKVIRYMAEAKGIEVALRPIPSANILVPYEIRIPTFAGSAILKSQRVEITTGVKQIALVH